MVHRCSRVVPTSARYSVLGTNIGVRAHEERASAGASQSPWRPMSAISAGRMIQPPHRPHPVAVQHFRAEVDGQFPYRRRSRFRKPLSSCLVNGSPEAGERCQRPAHRQGRPTPRLTGTSFAILESAGCPPSSFRPTSVHPTSWPASLPSQVRRSSRGHRYTGERYRAG